MITRKRGRLHTGRTPRRLVPCIFLTGLVVLVCFAAAGRALAAELAREAQAAQADA